MITVWTGHEADALRRALRASLDEFALQLGVSRRAAAAWSSRGHRVKLRWDIQTLLDDLQRQLPEEVRARFRQLLQEPKGALVVAPPRLEPRSPLPTFPQARAVSRRSLLPMAAIGLAAPMALLAAEPAGRSLARGLVSTLVAPSRAQVEGALPAQFQLERAIAQARLAFQQCRFQEVLDALPALMALLNEAKSTVDTHQPDRVARLAASLSHLTTSMLLHLGDVPMAMLAAERSSQEAQASRDPIAIAASARSASRVLMRSGHYAEAADLGRAAAGRLTSAADLRGPRALSGYGALHLKTSVACARGGDRSAAFHHLRLAEEAAQRLGEDGNFGWTAFGPTNVRQHHMHVLTDLGDYPAVIKLAETLPIELIRYPERRLVYLLDVAQANLHLGRTSHAREALRLAHGLVPRTVPGPRLSYLDAQVA